MPRPRAPPVSSWPMVKAEQRSPFAPAPLQGLARYYGLLRPCAPHRYSRPCGWSRLQLLPSRHQRDGAQVLTFRTKAWSSFAPPTCRMSLGQPQASPELIPEEGSPPGLTSPNPLSTLLQRFACARLSQPRLPESCPDFSATFTTIAFDDSSLQWLEINT